MATDKIDAKTFAEDPTRFVLVKGDLPGAPTCPFGNHLALVGFDLKNKSYVRFTKSVYVRLKEANNKS